LTSYVHAFFHDCYQSGRQARALVSCDDWFESREERLFDWLRFEVGITTVIQVLLKIGRRHFGATIVA
jgi:hypothetical protein